MGKNLPEKNSLGEIKHALNTQQMRKAVFDQLKKDLDWEMENIDVEAGNFFAELTEKLTYYFNYIIENQPGKIPNFIYRVDIDESKLKRIMTQTESLSAQKLAEMTLERTMLKVFYRNVYNGNITF
jgi:hypothetical protein